MISYYKIYFKIIFNHRWWYLLSLPVRPHLQAGRSRDGNLYTGIAEKTRLNVSLKNNYTIAILVGNKQEMPLGINTKIAGNLALGGGVT